MSSLRFFWVLQAMMWCLGLNFTVGFCGGFLRGVIGWGCCPVRDLSLHQVKLKINLRYTISLETPKGFGVSSQTDDWI